MIQRIQSLYLSMTILLSLLFLKGSFLNFADASDSVLKVTFTGIVRDTDVEGFKLIEKLLPLSGLFILIPLLSLAALFVFKYRKIQLWFTLAVIIFEAGLIIVSIFYSLYVIKEYRTEIVPGLKMVIPVLMLGLTLLALKGIRKDDRLISSYDRLR